MPLTHVKIRSAKSKEKTFKLFDGGGLYLEVNVTGGKYWRWKYRFAGKEKRLACGVYPDVSLKMARDKRDVARKQLAPLVFVRPGELRKAQWSEIDLEKAEWRIPGERMKMGEKHIVPLSRQAVEILRALQPLTNRPMPSRPNRPCYVFRAHVRASGR